MKSTGMKIVAHCVLLISCYLSCFECISETPLDWWQTQVVYQIYPRSFKDSNGDGIGDIKGIYQKLPYLKSLGVGCIWLSPILKSPMTDFGYDVSNFQEVDPLFGSMDDLEILIKMTKKLGMKVIMDFVPNHTSDEHEWFRSSIKRIPPYTDYYIWRDAKYTPNGTRLPPNNWLSEFGKTAWQWNEQRGQYYLHQFAAAQPDLDFRNPVVYEEMKNNIAFWLDKGIDGLRIDSVNFIYENPEFSDEPRSFDSKYGPEEQGYLKHIYTRDQPEDVLIVQDWRRIFDRYSAKGTTRFMVTEAYAKVEHLVQYYGNSTHPGANAPFNFLLITDIDRKTNASHLHSVINSWYENMPKNAWANWVIGNHDNPRPVTRIGHYLVDGFHMIQLLLPGTPFVYSGDELGMEDTFIRFDESVDPRALIAGPDKYERTTRDGCRTPFQWDDSENSGFTTGEHPWLPLNPNYWRLNVKNELNSKEDNHLGVFKDLVKLRENTVFQRGDLSLYTLSDWVFAFTRSYMDHSTYAVVINLGSRTYVSNLLRQRPSLPANMTVEIASVNSYHRKGEIISTSTITLRPKASIVLATNDEANLTLNKEEEEEITDYKSWK